MWASQAEWMQVAASVLVCPACCSLMQQRDWLLAMELQRGSAEGGLLPNSRIIRTSQNSKLSI